MGKKRAVRKGEFIRPLIPTTMAGEVAVALRNHAHYHDSAGNRFIANRLREIAKEVKNGKAT